jgi:predicted ATPase
MLTRMKLENFKSWQSLDIEIAPLTILFGTNSSGKSSILQSILLLIQSSEQTGLNGLNFGGKDDYVNLGSFRDIVFEHDLEKTVSIGFTYNNVVWDFSLQYKNDDTQITGNAEWSPHGYMGEVVFEELVHYLGPLRQYPQRSYLWSGSAPFKILPDGENTIAALIESTRRDSSLLNEVSKWLVELDLVNKFRVNPLDKDKRFYETLVNMRGVESALLDTGFGVSQILPVITMLFFVPEESVVLLEQPELHLHPRAQAHLADLILHVAEERKLQLIVESHSEHLLRRLQRRIAEPEHEFANPDNIKMYFCDMGDNGSTIQEVKVDEYGQIQNWPDKFFGDITGDLEAMTMAALKRVTNGKN